MKGAWLVRFDFGNSLAACLELILWAGRIEEDVGLALAQERSRNRFFTGETVV
jgi:hypothetical protein